MVRTFQFALAAACVAWAPSCKSPVEHRAEADREVYALIDSRREVMFPAASEPVRLVSADEALPPEALQGDPWSLVDCLEIAAATSREAAARREDLYSVALALTFERWRFGTRGSASISGFVTGLGGDAQSAGLDALGGLSRQLGSGGVVEGSLGLRVVRSLLRGDGWDALSSASLAITQPLLQGRGRLVTLEPLTQAERDLVYEVRDYERFRRSFAFDVATEFYGLIQARDELRNEERNYETLVELRRRNEALAEAGRLSDIEVDQARQDELRSANRLLEIRNALEARQDGFKLFLGIPMWVEFGLDADELERLVAQDAYESDIELESAALEVALSDRLDLTTASDRVADRVRRVRIDENQLLPGLDVTANALASSDEGRPLSVSGSSVPWNVGLTLDLPIERLPERNAYRQSLIELDVAQRDLEQLADQVRADVRDALRDAVATRESYRIQRGAVELAERRVESARLMLEAGRASTRDLLEAQGALLEAQNAATAALIDTTLARLRLYLDIEALRVDETGVYPDPMVLARLTEGLP